MRFPTLICPLLSLAAFSARADLPIAIPAPSKDISSTYGTALDTTSANAKQIKQLCGATYYKGSASSAGLTETAKGELSLQYSLTYSAQDGAYGTTAGLLLPIDPARDIKDLSLARAITFQIKAAVPGVTVHLIIGSPNYPADVVAAGAALVSPATLALTDSFQTVTVIPWTDLALPTWLNSSDGGTVAWVANGVNTLISIGNAVQDLNFQPILDSAWDSTGTGFKPGTSAITSNTITIRNVDIPGIGDPVPVHGTSCTGSQFLTVDDFNAWATSGPNYGKLRKAADPNYLGGAWYAFSDTSSARSKLNDSSTGKSRIILPSGQSSWAPFVGSGAFVTAQLEKNDTGSSFLYHKYAGWADIGTNLPGHNPDRSLNLQDAPGGGTLTGIAFAIYAGAGAGAMIPGATFDTNTVRRVIFKVGRASVSDSEAFQVSIPVSQALMQYAALDGPSICVDVSDLKQPTGSTPVKSWSASDLTKLSWEIRIENQSDSTIHATSVPNTYGIASVQLYGVTLADLTTGIKATRTRASALRASYTGALQLSYAVDGTSAQIDVRSLDGTRIASFRNAATVRDLSLPVALSRGTYLVSVQGSHARQVALLSVVR